MMAGQSQFEPLAEKALELTIELRNAVDAGELHRFEGLTASRGEALESLGSLLNSSEDAVALRSSALWTELQRENDALLCDLKAEKAKAAEALGLSRNRSKAERHARDEVRLVDQRA